MNHTTMTDEFHPKRVTLTIDGSEPANIPVFIDQAHRLSFGSLDDSTAAEVELALMEALNNTMIHGCGLNKSIQAILETSPHELRIQLEYEGVEMDSTKLANARAIPAFDPRDISTLPEGGMGLPIIYSIMDEVMYDFNHGACRWTFIKNLNDESHE